MMPDQEHDMPPSCCTACGIECDTASGVADADGMPESGDVTVCLACGHIMAFDHDLRLRDLTDDEVCEVAGDARLLAIAKARAWMKTDQKR
jgi:hypothetical protein